MTRITEQYANVRVTTTGMSLDGSDTVQYFNGTDWVDYLTVYQFEDNMKSKRDKTVDMLRRKYPEPAPEYVRYVAQIRTTAPIKNDGTTYYFDTREEAQAFIKSNNNFYFFGVKA
jgi:hypothetical protein